MEKLDLDRAFVRGSEDVSLEREAKVLHSEERPCDFSPQKVTMGGMQDPLGDIIDWLGYADLPDDNAPKDPSSRGLEVGGSVPRDATARELFAKATSPASGDGLHFGGATSSGDTGEPPVFTGRQKSSSSSRGLTGYCGLVKEPSRRGASGVEPEEEEWDARQQQTGAAGRLVKYEEGERPRQDFMLRGGSGRRIMVSAVTEGGKAAQAGVKAGDVLVSIDGKKDFKEYSADHVHAHLKGPVMLVFLGFVGKLQAEVRLNYKQKVCGLSSQHQVVFGRPDAPVQVVDEVIFQPGMATLLLATSPPGPRPSSHIRSLSRGKGGAGAAGDDGAVDEDCQDCQGCNECQGRQLSQDRQEPDDVGNEGAPAAPSCVKSVREGPSAETLAAVYELRGPEARSLVSSALSRARTSSPFVPRYMSPHNPHNGLEDQAQVPRSLATSISPFTTRLDSNYTSAPDLIPGKPFRFTTNGNEMLEF